MKLIKRKGGLAIVQAKDGRIWLSKRKKIRHNSRRQKPTKKSVYFIPIIQIHDEKDIDKWL